MRPLLLVALYVSTAFALPFQLIKKETYPSSSPTLLIIAGIHGNEPGSYFAAALLSQYYTIHKGNIWIVPDLNRESILQNNRGIYGDMNRKFADLNDTDPDYPTVTEIKKIIEDPQIDLILNLHDGHGFYRKKYQNTIFNPNAWGQTCVIDQGELNASHPFSNLSQIATRVSEKINKHLIKKHHLFDVRNTNTRFDDEAMRHSLTYYSVTHHKPAFAIETSKNLPTLHEKVFYHLKAIESYMDIMGIAYESTFDLTPKNVENTLRNHGNLIINNKFYLNLNNLKNSLSYIPIQSEHNDFIFSHPLGNVRPNGNVIDIFIGNQKITSLHPSYHAKDSLSQPIVIEIDGKPKKLDFATVFSVTADFKVINNDPEIRVNIIGLSKKESKDESNILVSRKDLDPKFAVDKSLKSYRIEFYRQNRFCGMVLVHFK